jgi:uncharacterized protein (TIGR02453 family)
MLNEAFAFLEELSQNNNREWFNLNKKNYEAAQTEVLSLVAKVLDGLNKTDVIENPTAAKCLHRIYRDIRFKTDKTPYKNNFSARFMRATAYRRGSYYLHLSPGNCFVGGGFWSPNPEDLKTIRERIALEEQEYRGIILSKDFVKMFGQLRGEKLKTVPKGFNKTSTALDLIQAKQFLLIHNFTSEEIASEDFDLKIVEAFEAMRPYLDIMTYFLTTNLNGESL